ncbi:uncharacterized protein LODBEIA_P57780 [Lodderomyces beijingensis]|uniref:NAD-dependent epimerase/dehydratase domain-containing protein n=1 Tax=Lodderomyces beijingensis TaxID=1775926 RepID=A0ABP0ZUH4_9ASCO
MPETVIITGGTGYVGQHIIGQLLANGYTVVAIVRSPVTRLNLIKQFDSPFLLSEVVDQLDKPKSIDFVLKVHHEATVFIAAATVTKFDAQDQEKEVLNPGLAIIENTLESIKHHGKQIKRVILTSSGVTMTGIENANGLGAKYSDDDWSPLTFEDGKKDGWSAYFVSKKINEQLAWKFMEEKKPHFDLVSINPTLCLGPTEFRNEVSLDQLPSTTSIVGSLLKLHKDSYVPELACGAIDVRDVARVHVAVINNPKAAGQRLLLEAYKATNPNILYDIRKNFPELDAKLPDLAPSPESEVKAPNDARTREILGIEQYEYTLEQSVVDLVKQILK